MKSMTYADALNYAIANIDNAEVTEKLTALLEQTIKRNAKPTATQVAKQEANTNYKDLILNTIAICPEGATVDEIRNMDVTLGALSNQKVSALMRQLIDENLVKRDVRKRKSYFMLVNAE